MKSLTCDLCEAAFEAETFEEWMEKMKPHYMEAHKDIMEMERENPEQERTDWITASRTRFDAAENI